MFGRYSFLFHAGDAMLGTATIHFNTRSPSECSDCQGLETDSTWQIIRIDRQLTVSRSGNQKAMRRIQSIVVWRPTCHWPRFALF
jgi:hypothetical protein